MKVIPDISTSRSDVVVDDIRFRAPLLGLFGEPAWRVLWRLAGDPMTSSMTRLHAGQNAGTAELGGQSFDFVVRWRRDLRRPIGARPSGPSREEALVTPGAVLQLRKYPTGAE